MKNILAGPARDFLTRSLIVGYQTCGIITDGHDIQISYCITCLFICTLRQPLTSREYINLFMYIPDNRVPNSLRACLALAPHSDNTFAGGTSKIDSETHMGMSGNR